MNELAKSERPRAIVVYVLLRIPWQPEPPPPKPKWVPNLAYPDELEDSSRPD